MSVWAIGDLQGCYDATQRLLEKIRFGPAQDRLWFCGDLVNRGGQSLETLRLVHSLREHCVVVLGNHDLSLLAIGERSPDEQRKVNPDLQRVVLADDARMLLDWLRLQKLLHVDRDLGWMIDASHNVKDPLEDLLQSVEAILVTYAQALIVDRARLVAAQQANDTVAAQEVLQSAFRTDVRALVAEARLRAGASLDPLGFYRSGKIREHLIKERGTGAVATGL